MDYIGTTNTDNIGAVRQISQSDSVLGGPLGTINLQALDMSSRDVYLKEYIDLRTPTTTPTVETTYVVKDTTYHNINSYRNLFLNITTTLSDGQACGLYIGSTNTPVTKVWEKTNAEGYGASTHTMTTIVPPNWYFKFTTSSTGTNTCVAFLM